MAYEEFKKAVTSLKNALNQSKQQEEKKISITNFKQSRSQHLTKLADGYINALKRLAPKLTSSKNPETVLKIQALVNELDIEETRNEKIDQIITLLTQLTPDSHSQSYSQSKKFLKSIPSEIKSEISADMDELDKCLNAGCYRSAVILCGRILETALHRKYFEITEHDILEKNPGIGLGKLIAKLAEKNVKFDPGLTQQIHLINQVRIFSVHKKQEAFYPSKSQTQAIILYTTDVLEKIFAK